VFFQFLPEWTQLCDLLNPEYQSVDRYYSFWLFKIAGTAKTDVIVTIGRRIIQIEVKSTRISAIVPITTADKAAL